MWTKTFWPAGTSPRANRSPVWCSAPWMLLCAIWGTSRWAYRGMWHAAFQQHQAALSTCYLREMKAPFGIKIRPSVSSPIWNEPARAACGNQDSMASERIKVLLRSLFLSLIPIVDDTITAPLVLNRKTIRAKFLKSCVLLCEKHIAAPFAHAARKLISNFL